MISLATDTLPLPAEPLCWTASGHVQIRISVVRDGRCFGAYFPVPAMQLSHASGPRALAKALAKLPHATPAVSVPSGSPS